MVGGEPDIWNNARIWQWFLRLEDVPCISQQVSLVDAWALPALPTNGKRLTFGNGGVNAFVHHPLGRAMELGLAGSCSSLMLEVVRLHLTFMGDQPLVTCRAGAGAGKPAGNVIHVDNAPVLESVGNEKICISHGQPPKGGWSYYIKHI